MLTKRGKDKTKIGVFILGFPISQECHFYGIFKIYLNGIKYQFLTSKASRSAFPIIIKAITKLIIANPGITAKYAFPKII